MLNVIFNRIKYLLLQCLLLCLRFYQLFISPMLGSSCRFYPSCSHYSQDALIEHGIIKGCYLTVHRICRCHPGTPGGFDPVPPKHHSEKTTVKEELS